MADITIYTDLSVNVIQGPPPGDQSAIIAQLTADLQAVAADRDALNVKIANAVAAANAAKTADAATVEGQAVLDALA